MSLNFIIDYFYQKLVDCKNLTTYAYIMEKREREEREAMEARSAKASATCCSHSTSPTSAQQQSCTDSGTGAGAGAGAHARQTSETRTGPGVGGGEDAKYVRAPSSAGSRPASTSAVAPTRNGKHVRSHIYFTCKFIMYCRNTSIKLNSL